MYDIDRVAASMVFLLNDFYRVVRHQTRLRVFLCGKEPRDSFRDSRKQVKHLLSTRMGCEPFLGEDIDDLKDGVTLDKDHLTVEIREANRSDLIIIFLESPGTIAEVTAFAMTRELNPKVAVFNDRKYENVRSFLSCGPLKLLPKNRIIYYDGTYETPTAELVRHLDLIVANAWFDKLCQHDRLHAGSLDFFAHVTLLLISACFPVRYADLAARFPSGEDELRRSLKTLFDLGEIRKVDDSYAPVPSNAIIQSNPILERDIARVRLTVWNDRLCNRQKI